MDIFNAVISAGIPHDNHASDLYIPVTAETINLVAAYAVPDARMFRDQITGSMMYDLPFQYLPFWAGRLQGFAS